jgi:hypothetical protein
VALTAAVAVSVWGLSLLAVSPAGAATNGSWQILPKQADARGQSRPFFSYELRAGDRIEDVATVTNLTDDPIELRLRSADAVNAAGTGAWALRPPGAASLDLGSWVTTSQRSVVVPPQHSVDVPFVVDVPRNASPGDHAGALVTSAPGARVATSGGTASVTVVREVGVRIYARVVGDAASGLDVSGAAASVRAARLSMHGRATVRFNVRNTGIVRLSATTDVRVRDALGRTRRRLEPVRMSDLLPGADVPVVQTWRTPSLVIGPLYVQVRVRAGAIERSTSTSVWVTSWWMLAAAALVVTVLAAALVRLSRARRRRRRPAPG